MPRTGGPPSPLPLPLPLPPGTATHRKYSIVGRTTRNCICLLVLPTYQPVQKCILYCQYCISVTPPLLPPLHICRYFHSQNQGSGSPDGAPHRWTSLPPAPAPAPTPRHSHTQEIQYSWPYYT